MNPEPRERDWWLLFGAMGAFAVLFGAVLLAVLSS